MARTCRVVGGESATIFLVADDGQSLTVRASRGPAGPAAGVAIGVGEGVVGRRGPTGRGRHRERGGRHRPGSARSGRQGVVSLVAAPLLVGGHVIGVVQVGTGQKHRFVPRDLRLLQLVADRSAASIERARLDEDARRSRLGAEHARLHLSILALAGDEMATALESYDDALTRLVGVIVPTFADWFAVDLAESSGEVRRVACGARARDTVASSLHRHPQGDDLVRRVMATGRPEVLDEHPVPGAGRQPRGRHLRRGPAGLGDRIHGDRPRARPGPLLRRPQLRHRFRSTRLPAVGPGDGPGSGRAGGHRRRTGSAVAGEPGGRTGRHPQRRAAAPAHGGGPGRERPAGRERGPAGGGRPRPADPGGRRGRGGPGDRRCPTGPAPSRCRRPPTSTGRGGPGGGGLRSGGLLGPAGAVARGPRRDGPIRSRSGPGLGRGRPGDAVVGRAPGRRARGRPGGPSWWWGGPGGRSTPRTSRSWFCWPRWRRWPW